MLTDILMMFAKNTANPIEIPRVLGLLDFYTLFSLSVQQSHDVGFGYHGKALSIYFLMGTAEKIWLDCREF